MPFERRSMALRESRKPLNAPVMPSTSPTQMVHWPQPMLLWSQTPRKMKPASGIATDIPSCVIQGKSFSAFMADTSPADMPRLRNDKVFVIIAKN